MTNDECKISLKQAFIWILEILIVALFFVLCTSFFAGRFSHLMRDKQHFGGCNLTKKSVLCTAFTAVFSPNGGNFRGCLRSANGPWPHAAGFFA
jgi:hypothetical protein